LDFGPDTNSAWLHRKRTGSRSSESNGGESRKAAQVDYTHSITAVGASASCGHPPRREITAASIIGVGDHGSLLVSAMVVVIQVLPDVEPIPKTEPGRQCPERVTVYNFRRLNLLFGRGRFSSPRHQSAPSSTICKYKGHEGQTYMMAERQMITIEL
jgi:hypothetical protein